MKMPISPWRTIMVWIDFFEFKNISYSLIVAKYLNLSKEKLKILIDE
ncbi:hypothetical protein QIA30_06195 (plasmid) [Borreliella turdi]